VRHTLVYADDSNLLGEILNTTITHTKALCLEEITQKNFYMLIPHHHNSEHNHNIKTANRFSENVADFK
jgi:hypothetical protein